MRIYRPHYAATAVSIMLFLLGTIYAEGSAASFTRFYPIFGIWNIERTGTDDVYIVHGEQWTRGTLAAGAQDLAPQLFGEQAALFLKHISAYKAFPLSIYRDVSMFERGTVTVSFKTMSGKEDQAAGIAFNIRENGEYLAVRANALENNLILFTFKNGRRSRIADADDVPTASQQWHTLMVVLRGKQVEGYLDGKKYIDHMLSEPVQGRIGLWSKADSHVVFTDFDVQKN